MPPCPRCSQELQDLKNGPSHSLNCPHCGGMAVNVSLLRSEKTRKILADLWRRSEADSPDGPPCPGCAQPLLEISCAPWEDAPKLTLDLCRLCQLIWFDRGEFERWPKTAVKKLPEEAEQALALADVEFRSELARIDPNTRKMRRDEVNLDRAVRVGKSFVTGGPLSPWTWFNILRDEIKAVIDNIRA